MRNAPFSALRATLQRSPTDGDDAVLPTFASRLGSLGRSHTRGPTHALRCPPSTVSVTLSKGHFGLVLSVMADAQTGAVLTSASASPPAAPARQRVSIVPTTGTTPRNGSGTPTNKRVRKQCSATGCVKVDAGGGFCVGHGGGKKCSFPGCTKGYQTGGFCRKHGGGARCQVPGCGKVDAGKGLCRAHGGGRRCQAASCPKADVGGGFCTAHGGGKRCTEPGYDGQLCSTCARERGAGSASVDAAFDSDSRRSARRWPAVAPVPSSYAIVASHSGASLISSDEGYSSSDSGDVRNSPAIITPDIEPTCYGAFAQQLRAVPEDLDSWGLKNIRISEDTSATQAVHGFASGCGGSLGTGSCNCPPNCRCHRLAAAAGAVLLAQLPDAADEQIATIALKRYIVQLLRQPSDPFTLDAMLALVAAAEGIRSVHDITSSTASPVAAETTTLSEGNGVDDCSGDAKQNKNLLH
ncbi:hypothetical protein PybrP1_003203, partial [[Pythium] brassicae (nom. inval.)]